LGKPVGEMEEFARAKRPRRLPEVMTRDEVHVSNSLRGAKYSTVVPA
jgi:hypothetical protein